MKLLAVLRFGLIGACCGIGSFIGFDIGSATVPVPYEAAVPRVEAPLEVSSADLLLICVAAVVFFALYGSVLALIQGRAGLPSPSRSQLISIGIYAALFQATATFATDAFTKTRVGWNLDQSISLPLLIAGATLPGLVVAAAAILLNRRD